MPPVIFIAIAIVVVAVATTSILIAIAIAIALFALYSLLSSANRQRPAEQKQNIKQAIPPRRRSYGRVKLGGPFGFLNDKNSYMYMIILICQGVIDAFEEHWFGSDKLTLAADAAGFYATGPARYTFKGGRYVNLEGHVGTETQTADSVMVSDWAGTLDSNYRLLGIAYTRLRLKSPKAEDFSQVWPAGLPSYNAVIRAALVWDPRDPAQDPDDKSTWTWTQNAALIIMDYLWHEDGMRLPREMIVAAIDTWKLQATACDTPRTLDDASNEAWYRLSGTYQLSDAPKQVLPLMLEPIDGRLGLRPDGAIIIDVGQWQPPDILIADENIAQFAMLRGRAQGDVRNEIRAQYVSPENNYIEADAEPYVNQDSIDVDGRQSIMMDLSWSPSHAQARYRMKIEAGRHDATRWSGQVITNAYGMKFMTVRPDGTRRRTIALSIAELGIDRLGFEVQRFNFDAKTGKCIFSVFEMSFADYEWNATTDQGDPPATPDPITAAAIEDPDNLTASIVDSTITGGLVAKHIEASVDAPAQDGLTLILQYRTHDIGVSDDDAVWTNLTLDGETSGHTGTLPDAGDYDVRVAWRGPQGDQSNFVYQRSISVSYSPSLPTSPAGVVTASEDLTAGQFINLYSSSGAKIRKANATDETKPAHGFVKAAVTSGNTGTVYGPGMVNDQLSGLTPGATYYLSTTGGGITATPPSTIGNVIQEVGQAISATELLFEPEETIQL